MLPKEATILIVDDMRLIRSAMKMYLKSLGYDNVIEAGDGKEALQKYQSDKPGFVFLDIVMPQMTGDEVLKEIRKTDKNTPVVMLTSVADEKTIQACQQAGIVGYAIKPINKENGPQLLSEFLAKV
jgi:two-component system chemotaxis response regulator CheY